MGGIGPFELLIVAAIGLLCFGVPIAIVVALVVMSTRRKG